jgi:hypothetical protein
MLHDIRTKSSKGRKYTSAKLQRVGTETHPYGDNSGNKVQASQYAKRLYVINNSQIRNRGFQSFKRLISSSIHDAWAQPLRHL